MSELASYRAEFSVAAIDCLGADWLRFVNTNGFDRHELQRATLLPSPILARCEFFEQDRFDFANDGEPAAVIQAIGPDGCEVVDFVAWALSDPSVFGTACGRAAVLGVDQIQNPATYHAGQPLAVHRTPLAWLQAQCRGVVILNARTAPMHLVEALGPIAGDDVEHAREIAKLMHGLGPRRNILAPEAAA